MKPFQTLMIQTRNKLCRDIIHCYTVLNILKGSVIMCKSFELFMENYLWKCSKK